MATTSTSNDQSKSVDGSLWWDSFTVLLTELENASVSSDLPASMVKKLKDNHAWFVGTVSLFKPPNQKSREALNSRQVIIGSHQLSVLPELKDAALKISSVLCLDEVQSYILVKRSIDGNSLPNDPLIHEPLHLVILQYYLERQCLLKCTRQILMHALYVADGSNEGQAMRNEAQKLISDGLESRLLSVLEDLLSCSYPDHMDVDIYTLWAEEILIEDNLVLDNLFLAYYESFCTCNGQQWKRLCLIYEGMISGSCNFGKLALSTEATHSVYNAKVQLLLILMETLDLENLLQMIHDETPFSQGIIAFSVTDIQDIDAIVSGLDAFGTKEAGPLILTWAVFLCLVSSLPEKQEYNVVMEIDHVGYVRQAFKAASLNYFLEILQSTVLKDSDGPIAGYRSILRTFISSFIASYEINLQLEDNSLKLILEILGKIYRGEESLCSQFWDRDSFIDGPIRCLLCNLEGEFPFRTVELVRLLSALAEGTWPAECVYTFLNKSVGLSSLFVISRDTLVDSVSQIVETQQPLSVPGLEGLVIPSRTRGHVLKMIDGNTALVRWEYAQSGMLVLLLRLAQKIYLDGTEEVLITLDLLVRLVTFNTAVCYALIDTGNSLYDEATQMNQNTAKVNVVEIICFLIKNTSPSCSGAIMMSMGVNILAKMLKCLPSHVSTVALKGNIFDVALQTNPFSAGSDALSSGSWLLSGRLAKMLLIDCEHNDSRCPLTLSVLDFTMQLVETGVQSDLALALVTFSIQYVLVNHEYWKYMVRHARWDVTLKVLEVIKKCILSIQYSQKLGEVVRDILLCDSSVHNALFRIVCTTTQALEKLYISRHYELVEIEGIQLAVCSVLDILSSMLSDLLKDALPSVPIFHQAVLSSATKPIPVFTAVISLISCFRNPTIQTGAARVLSKLFVVADYSQPYVFGNACFGLCDNEIADFRGSIIRILCEQYQSNEDLVVAMFQMLSAASDFQPAFLVAVIDARNKDTIQSSDANGVTRPNESSEQASFLDALLQYVGRSDHMIKSNPSILLNLLNFLKSLWQGAAQFANILELLKSSAKFWKQLSSILLVSNKQDQPSNILTDVEALSAAYKYQCQSDVLQIMAYEIFLQKKLSYAELQTKQTPGSSVNRIEKADAAIKTKDGDLNDIFSTWCKSSELGNLIKAYASCQYDNETYLRAKIAGGLLFLDVMAKVRNGDTGSLSMSFIEKISTLSTKLSALPSFSELVTQYSHRGYSAGKELNSLILSDLYYHMQGELEGRNIDNGPFKHLSMYLVESKFMHTYQQKYDGDLSSQAKDVYLFDLVRLRADLGLDLWDYSEWTESKAVAGKLMLYLQEVNSMVLLAKSKISALKALISTLSVYNENPTEKQNMIIGGKIPEQLISPLIDQICECLRATIESLAPVPDAREEILDFISAQVELLLHLIRSSTNKKFPLPTLVSVLKTSGSGLKVLIDLWPTVANVRETMKLMLMLLLSSVELSSIISSDSSAVTEMESVEAHADASNASLGLLPILCKCTESADHCAISLTTVDQIIKGFLTPGTWFPIIQKHLPLQHLVYKLQDKSSLSSVPVILKFLLTLARVREGAKLILHAGFFASLRELLAELSDGGPHFQIETNLSSSPDKVEKPQQIWGLGLAVVTAVIHSLGGTSSCADIIDYVLAYFFAEKSYLISFYLNAPYFPSDFNKKKTTALSRKTLTTLSALKETEQTLILICVLAKHKDSWNKAMQVMDSQLRERSIHLLAFISRGNQRLVESPLVPLLCHPALKEEFEWYKEPSFVKSRNGWFALSPLGCGLDPRFSNLSSRATAHFTKDQQTDNTDPPPQTHFSDVTAIQMYRITFLLLKFLCLQAENAAKRAEEVGFVDIAHFPELPMPDILHGLQDQGIAIVYELCEANKLKQVSSEIQGICTLLMEITEMSLYLEFCVSQICGIRPVLGRLEDFSKELKKLLRGSEGHAFLKESVKSLKHIISFVYPGLLETEGGL